MSNILKIAGAGVSAAAEPSDADFENVTLLLHGDGTNGAQNNTFLDSSTNNFTITRNGNTTQGTFSPFSKPDGRWSNYFDGSGDYLSVADNAALQFGTGDFTISFWFYGNGTQDINSGIIGKRPSSPTTGDWSIAFDVTTPTTLEWRQFGPTVEKVIATNVSPNEWHHVVVVSDSGTIRTYFDSVAGETYVNSDSLNGGANALLIGVHDAAAATPRYFNGYLSNIYINKGTALIPTSNPTSPNTNISGTSLLTCQSNRFIDNSSNAFALTAYGDVKVTPFSPFPTLTAYDAATNGGSGYFDGSGDYLTASSASGVGTGSFCFEAWVYLTNSSANQMILGNPTSGGMWIGINIDSANKLAIGRVFTAIDNEVSFTWTNGQWYHIAVNRNGTSIQFFVNGVQIGSTGTNSINYSTGGKIVGSESGGNAPFSGYISGWRFVNASVYTSAFTPPTAPPTAISNTELLCNFTNAGIIDNSMSNNLETVGNAQIDTTTKKYGTGSMEFDGTGDYLFMGSSAQTENFVFGTGDFTIEMWVYFNSVASGSLFEFRPASTNGPYPLVYFSSSGVLTYFADSNSRINSSSVSTGQWYHFALARSGTSTKMFLDGTQTGSTYTDSLTYLCRTGGPLIGVTSNLSSDALNGFIDDLRITKGKARYTTTFTPPTAALPDIGE